MSQVSTTASCSACHVLSKFMVVMFGAVKDGFCFGDDSAEDGAALALTEQGESAVKVLGGFCSDTAKVSLVERGTPLPPSLLLTLVRPNERKDRRRKRRRIARRMTSNREEQRAAEKKKRRTTSSRDCISKNYNANH
ncbi:uncharacterized protein DS421_12g372700 [Arachis hypogaea]|nr:uncharacterized protein DS421_12g372700 [Arachis hypogaea]